MNDILSKDEISLYCSYRNIDIHVLDSIDSTNNYAKLLCSDTLSVDSRKIYPESSDYSSDKFILVTSDEQTGGRGRQGKNFLSRKGTGIYMTCVFAPSFPLSDEKSLLSVTPVTAVLVRRSIYNICGINCGIKWINDLYLNNLKICGILTELDNIGNIIIGIGINCYETPVPEELKGKMGFLVTSKNSLENNESGKDTAKKDITRDVINIAKDSKPSTSDDNDTINSDNNNIKWNRNQLISEIASSIYDTFYKKSQIDTNAFYDEYVKNCFIIGKNVTVKNTGGTTYNATAEAIDERFRLIVTNHSTNERTTLISQEVSLIL